MSADSSIPALGLAAKALLVVVGLLNFSVFWRQLKLGRDQVDTAVRQLELARKQPDPYLIQRAIAETTDHIRLMVERSYLRPYFYSGAEWKQGDRASEDEVLAMAELMLCYQNDSRLEVEADLKQLIEAAGLDEAEARRRRELLGIFQTADARDPIEYAALTMQRRR